MRMYPASVAPISDHGFSSAICEEVTSEKWDVEVILVDQLISMSRGNGGNMSSMNLMFVSFRI